MSNRSADRNDVASMKPLPRPTLRKSLQRIHLIIIVVSMTISGISLSTLSLIALRNYAENNLELLASTLSFTVQSSVVKGDGEIVREALAEIGKRGSFAGRAFTIAGAAAGWLARFSASASKHHRTADCALAVSSAGQHAGDAVRRGGGAYLAGRQRLRGHSVSL